MRDFLRQLDAAKTEVICASVDITFAACANDVARAILIVAKERAAAVHSLFLVWLGRIKGRIGALWIVRYAAFIGQHPVVIGAIPIGAPFPNVSRHVVKTITI